jgi:beta-lactamase class A
VTLQAEDKRPGTGVIRSFDPGLQMTIKDLITMMIIVSDKTATDVIFRQVGAIEAVNTSMKSYGLNQTQAVTPQQSTV